MNREELAAEIESVSVRPDVTLTLSFKGDVWREVVFALREAGIPAGDGINAGQFHCACVFDRPADFSEAVLVKECAFHEAQRKAALREAERLRVALRTISEAENSALDLAYCKGIARAALKEGA